MATLNLRLDPRQMESGSDRAENALKGVKREAKQAESAIDQMAVSGGRSANRLGGAVRGMGARMQAARGQIQNTAFQVGDFATQVGAGTSASIALGQQLPQLLGGFGALGAVMGAVVAIGVPLASSFLTSAENADTLNEAVKGIKQSSASLREELALLQSDLDNVEQLRIQQELNELLSERARIQSDIDNQRAPEAVLRTMEGQVDALDDQIAAKEKLLADNKELVRELESAERISGDLADNLADADLYHLVVQANDLARQLGVSAELARMIQGTQSPTGPTGLLPPTGGGSADNGPGNTYGERLTLEDLELPEMPRPRTSSRGGGGRGGISEIERTADAYDRLIASMDPFERAAQDLAQSQDLITKAQAAGIITAEEAARAYGMAEDEYEKMIDRAKGTTDELEDITNATSGAFDQLFDGIVSGGTDAADVLDNLAAQLIKLGLQSALTNAFPGIFGDGGWLSFDGGGYTGSAPRSGGVDGKGGFPAILHPNETVVDHTKPANRNASGVSLQVNIINESGESLTETGRNHRTGPNGQEIIDIAVSDSISRGRQDSAMRSRFGVSNQRVRR